MSDDIITRLNKALEDRYEVVRPLGEGGMATVYLVDDIKHERKVALKVLKPELAAMIGGERFVAEIKTTANLQHPHILPLFDSGEADGFLYYVMPYVEGTTRTATTSSTGTSSRRTSCCTTAGRWWRTSGSRWRSAQRAAEG
jgi:serine/threonine protein kinase